MNYKMNILSCILVLMAQLASGQDTRSIEIVSHRGANHLAPENTYAAIQKALEYGAAWIEIDVRTSKDGVLYNFHDMGVSRTTNGTGFMRSLTSQEIDRLDAGSWFSQEFAGERVPRVADLLDSLKGKANVYFDVKDADLRQLIDLVREKGYEKNSFFWFGSLAMQREFLNLAPDLKIKVNAASVEKMQEWLDECAPVKPAIVETGVNNITPEFRDFCHSHGIRVMAIVTGDTSAYRDVILSKADMVNLDQPEVFQEALRNF
jgi:glycerophosphoryl diester phosphodiesterase